MSTKNDEALYTVMLSERYRMMLKTIAMRNDLKHDSDALRLAVRKEFNAVEQQLLLERLQDKENDYD